MYLINLFKILDSGYNNGDFTEIEIEKINIYVSKINFKLAETKIYIKQYLNYGNSSEEISELENFINYLENLNKVPEKLEKDIMNLFKETKNKEDQKLLSEKIFNLNIKYKKKFNFILKNFTKEIVKLLDEKIVKSNLNEVKSLLKIYVENNLNNMCDNNGNLKKDLNFIEILKDINSRTFKITPKKEFKENNNILKNVFEFSEETPPKITFNKGGRGELDIIYYNDFNFIGCSTTLSPIINFENNQLLNHPYKLYKMSEILDYDENVDIKKMLHLLKQDSGTESFDREFEKYNGKLNTKKELRANLLKIKTSKYKENILNLQKDEKLFKKILEEISFEFHLRKESFLVKDLKDYEKLIIKNMFMSALINNDFYGTEGKKGENLEGLYEFMSKINKSFLNIPFDIEKKYEKLDISKTNKDFSELFIHSLFNKDLKEIEKNEILNLYKKDNLKEEKIKERMLYLLSKNENYFNIIIRNLNQYITSKKYEKEDLGLISKTIEEKLIILGKNNSTVDFLNLKEREKNIKKDEIIEKKDKEIIGIKLESDKKLEEKDIKSIFRLINEVFIQNEYKIPTEKEKENKLKQEIIKLKEEDEIDFNEYKSNPLLLKKLILKDKSLKTLKYCDLTKLSKEEENYIDSLILLNITKNNTMKNIEKYKLISETVTERLTKKYESLKEIYIKYFKDDDKLNEKLKIFIENYLYKKIEENKLFNKSENNNNFNKDDFELFLKNIKNNNIELLNSEEINKKLNNNYVPNFGM